MLKKLKIAAGFLGAAGLLAFALPALATLTIGALTVDSDAALSLGASSATSVVVGSTTGATTLTLQAGSNVTLNGAVAAQITLGSATQTGAIAIGTSTATNTITIGNSNTLTGAIQTINIGAGTPAGTGKAVIVIGNTNGASALTLQAGSVGITLTGATTVTGTLEVTSTSTADSNLAVTGNLLVNTNKFVVVGSSGNTAIAGTLGVTGATTLASVSATGLTVGNASPANTAKLFQVATTTPASNYFFAVMGNGNISASGTLPTLSLSGTNARLYPGSNNLAGLIMVGGPIVSSSTMTFVPAFTNTPSCVASLATTTPQGTAGVAIAASATPTTVLFIGPANITNGVISYHCIGVGE